MSSTSPQPPFGGSYGVPGAPMGPGAAGPAPMPEPTSGKGRKKVTGKPVTKRVISRNVKFAAGFAVLFGVLIAAILFSGGAPKSYVAVATVDVAPLSQLGETQVSVQPIAPELIIDGAVSGASEQEVRDQLTPLIGSQVLLPIRKGEQINTGDFNSAAIDGIQLASDERLIALRATVAAAAGGSVKAGDRVDIYGADVSKSPTLVGLIVPDVEIISVAPSEDILNSVTQEQANAENKDKAASELLPSKPLGGTYIIRVKLADVNRLLAVNVAGEVFLALRGADAVTEDSIPTDVLAAVCGKDADPRYGIDSKNVAACTAAGYGSQGDAPAPAPAPEPSATPAPVPTPVPTVAPEAPEGSLVP